MLQMSSQGDDDSPDHPDVTFARKHQVNQMGVHEGAPGAHVPPPARNAIPYTTRGLLTSESYLSGHGSHGHYADRSRAQPDIPEELLPDIGDEDVPLSKK